MNPARSFIDRRTNVAAPPVSGRADVASAYESATSRKRRPAPRAIVSAASTTVAVRYPLIRPLSSRDMSGARHGTAARRRSAASNGRSARPDTPAPDASRCQPKATELGQLLHSAASGRFLAGGDHHPAGGVLQDVVDGLAEDVAV